MSIRDSFYKQYSNSTIQWLSPDSEDNWIKNNDDPLKRKILQNLNWTDNSIQYHFNSHGFRSHDFDGNGAMFLGCSFTFGVGMDWERTWAYKVAEELGLRCWNLGIGGGSNDTAFRLAWSWIPVLKPSYVFYLRTHHARFELLTDDGQLQFVPHNISKKSGDRDHHAAFAETWMTCPHNTEVNEQKNLLAIQQICSNHNIPLYTASIMDRYWPIYEADVARDMVHLGPNWNDITAKHFLRMVKNDR